MKSLRTTSGTIVYFLQVFRYEILQWYNCVPWKRCDKQNTRCREYRNQLNRYLKRNKRKYHILSLSPPPPSSRKQPLKRCFYMKIFKCASNYSSCRSMDEIAFAIWILNMFTKRTYNSSTTVMYEHKHKTTFLKRFFFLSKKIILETLILSKHKILNYPHQKLIKWNSLCNFMQ